MPYLWSCWHKLKLDERLSYFELLQQTKPGPITLHYKQKGNPWYGTNPKLHRRKKLTLCHMFATTVDWDCEGGMKCQEGRKLTLDFVKMLKELMKRFK
jgi:hypothetical protein